MSVCLGTPKSACWSTSCATPQSCAHPVPIVPVSTVLPPGQSNYYQTHSVFEVHILCCLSIYYQAHSVFEEHIQCYLSIHYQTHPVFEEYIQCFPGPFVPSVGAHILVCSARPVPSHPTVIRHILCLMCIYYCAPLSPSP